MESNLKFTRKVVRIGGSVVVALPAPVRKMYGIATCNKLQIECYDEFIVLTRVRSIADETKTRQYPVTKINDAPGGS